MSGLTAANAELERTLDDLRSAQDRLVLSEKMAAVGRLVAGIAHDVNSPLGALLSSVASIDEGLRAFLEGFPAFYDRLEEGDFGRYLDLVAAGAERARSLEPIGDRDRKGRLAEAFSPACADPMALAEAAEELGAFDAAEAELGEIGCERTARILAAAARTVAIVRSAVVAGEATRRTARIIAALRRFSLGGEAEARESIGLREEFSNVLALFQDKFKRGIEVGLDIGEGVRVSGDREGLGQVWIGLVANALQAMEYRGRLGVSARAEGDFVLVSVSDTGRGIRPEDRDRVFEPFFTTKKVGEGMGLSLSIARKVVEANGGGIDFESEPGRTVFRVRLPAAKEG
jgi:signal transduction histidine kinase